MRLHSRRPYADGIPKSTFRIQANWEHENPSKSRHAIFHDQNTFSRTYVHERMNICNNKYVYIIIHLLIYGSFNDVISSWNFMMCNIKMMVSDNLERSDRVLFEVTIPAFVWRSLGKQLESSARIVGILAKTGIEHLRNKVSSITAWANWSLNLMMYWMF
jgi:hypothetical protein